MPMAAPAQSPAAASADFRVAGPGGHEGVVCCCDCVERMKEIPDESVDLVIADPPYNINVQKSAWDKYDVKEYMKWSRCVSECSAIVSFVCV